VALRQASLRVTVPIPLGIGVGFPEFTRSFNHGFPWKLQKTYSRSLYQLSYRGTPFVLLDTVIAVVPVQRQTGGIVAQMVGYRVTFWGWYQRTQGH
jgi:hypothetical protein